jgi:hypothetical protein
MVISGWRAAVAVVIGLVVLALLIAVALWVAISLAILGAVLWLNVVVLPRLSRRLRVPRIVLDLICLPVLAGAGWLLNGPTGAVLGALAWLTGIVVPQLVGRRLIARMTTARGGPTTVIVLDSPARDLTPPAAEPGRR